MASIPDHIEDGFQPGQGSAAETSQPVPDLIPVELIKQALGPSFSAIFKAIASARGPHWKLEGFEQEALVNGWSPIVQLLLAKLGSSEQVLFTLALGSTAAIVGGKIAQDTMLRASSKANTRTPGSGASFASSASAGPVRVEGPENWSAAHDDV